LLSDDRVGWIADEGRVRQPLLLLASTAFRDGRVMRVSSTNGV
jgi:hypothetical protein